MKMNKLLSTLFILSVLFFTSCSKDDDATDDSTGDTEMAYENGILISGEGSTGSTASISYVSDDFSVTENLIYKNVNDTELGIYLQSMAFDDSRAFIVVDNTNTITVVDRYTFEEEATITTGLLVPRYMTVVGNKAYVTNWGTGSFGADVDDDFIAVINLDTYTVESTIDVAIGPERIIENDGKLYVSHKGAYSTNNIISVITIADDTVEEVTVKDNPDELFFDSSGNLIVLSQGRTLYDENWNVTGNTLAAISKINTSTLVVDSELDFADGEHPSLMVLEGDTIYYALNNVVYEMDVDATALPTSAFLTGDEVSLYGMEVDDDNIYLLDANFFDLSTLNVYDLNTTEKTQTISVALGASKIYFN